jgi:hypothetical protein
VVEGEGGCCSWNRIKTIIRGMALNDDLFAFTNKENAYAIDVVNVFSSFIMQSIVELA